MEIPAEVLAAAAGLVDMYGPMFSLLGERGGVSYYLFLVPENETTGFPFVYSLSDGKVLEISGFDAVDIIRSFGVE